MNRPPKLNALTAELVTDLHAALDDVAIDPDARVVILTGAGRGFCAGLDLGGFGTAPHSDHMGPTQRGFAVQRFIANVIPHLRSLPQPVIAAVNGPAAGGGFAFVLGSRHPHRRPQRASSTPRSSASASRRATSARRGCCPASSAWPGPRS